MIGLGLRTEHFNYLLRNPKTGVGWFEAITENFINTRGAPLHVLTKIREHYPVALHGVALSIGSAEGLRAEHLRKIKTLAERIDPFQISDHFCFSRHGNRQYHELLPLPLTQAMARRVIRNIDQAQTFLKRPLVFENISAYAEYPRNEMSEAEFLNFIARESGCKLLLDINNIYVNAANFRFNARRYLGGIDPLHVAQYHLAGFTDLGTHLFDTHAEKIHAPVLRLYREAKHLIGDRPVSLERDDRIPAFQILEREILKTAALAPVAMPERFQNAAHLYPEAKSGIASLAHEIRWQRTIYARVPEAGERSAGSLTVKGVQKIYGAAYDIRLGSALREKFTRLGEALGKTKWDSLIRKYIAMYPSTTEDLGEYGEELPRLTLKLFPKKPGWGDWARFDLLRYALFRLPETAAMPDLFSSKVRLGEHARLWRSRSLAKRVILYRKEFGVYETALTEAEYDFLSALAKPTLIADHLAAAETEKRLSAAAVKKLFRILGLPGILT